MGAVLLAISVVCAAVASLLGFGVFEGSHWQGWISLAVLFGFAAGLVGFLPPLRRP